MKIELEIERLVLRGVPVADREALMAVVRGELERLAADHAARGVVADTSRDVGAIDVGSIPLRPGASLQQTGGHIARAVWRGVMSAHHPPAGGGPERSA
ncbi:MAG: hypothetical protein AAGD38_10730 [Acidobacteriota bacterium]